MVGLVIFAGAIEIAQVLIPGRHARLSDFLVDAVSMCVMSLLDRSSSSRVLGNQRSTCQSVQSVG